MKKTANKTINLSVILILIFLVAIGCQPTQRIPIIPFDASQKDATDATIAANDKVREYLQLDDETDFINAQRGFMGTIEEGVIRDDNDSIAYSMEQFEFLKGQAPSTANPSLWRQSYLNSINGLFRVEPKTDGKAAPSLELKKGYIYQVRGFDVSNISFVKGYDGWIVIDPVSTRETAYAAMNLVRDILGEFPVTNIIITHSHLDHFGGIQGVIQYNEELDYDNEEDLDIYVPEGFFDEAVSENVMAGSAMGRRATYMYGNLLAKDEKGTLGSGMGTTLATGTSGILDGTKIIRSQKGVTRTLDSVAVEFFYTPDSEAPAEMMFYFPDSKAFFQAENLTRSLHNLYTLRGAKVRDGLKWSKYIDKTITDYGNDVEISFGPHHWPTWDNENIVPFWEKQRDLYKFLHDQSLRLANRGFTSREISEMLKLPESLDTVFHNRDYYGTISHNSKAQYQFYFGWFDGNPANLNPYPPTEAAKKYVSLVGPDAMLRKASKAYVKGDYRWVAELMNHLVFAEPHNQNAKYLLADAYEQLGYQAESGPWRNFYLSGAKELRKGMGDSLTSSMDRDMIAGMSTELLLDYLAMRFQGMKHGMEEYSFNLMIRDVESYKDRKVKEVKAALIIMNGAVTTRIDDDTKDVYLKDATATVALSSATFKALCFSPSPVKFVIKNNHNIEIEGDKDAFKEFLSALDDTAYWFAIVTPQ